MHAHAGALSAFKRGRAAVHAADFISLDAFDDETLEIRSPREWMQLAALQPNGSLGARCEIRHYAKKAFGDSFGTARRRLVRPQALAVRSRLHLDAGLSNSRGGERGSSWREASVCEYDSRARLFKVQWSHPSNAGGQRRRQSGEGEVSADAVSKNQSEGTVQSKRRKNDATGARSLQKNTIEP
eukprot:1291728-Pleurochrysis_carterae.AAC.4